MTMTRREEQSAKDAIRTANAYAQFTVALVADVRRRWPELAERMRKGTRDYRLFTINDLRRAVRVFGDDVKRAHLIILTAEAVRQWQQHRVVYRLHPELATGLMETEPSAPIPCELFRRLPHPDPFVVFPTPLKDEIPDRGFPVVEGSAKLLGALVTGLTGDGDLCSTTDKRLAELNIAVAGSLQYVGQQVTYEEHSVRIPVSGQMTVDQMAVATNRSAGQDVPPDNLRAHQLAVSIMLYLCSDTRDIRTGEPDRRKQSRRTSTKPELTVIDIGFDIGPKLFAARRAREQAARQAAPGERPVRPHWRRAHWHTYNTGSRTDPIPTLRWLNPILINASERHPDQLTVIDATERNSGTANL